MPDPIYETEEAIPAGTEFTHERIHGGNTRSTKKEYI
uniref:Uncharacterized protein n=1 Tax=Arundo donax TaxID=35708 RepID=A0A0A8ZWQ9_ARUDO